ncbi:hypothetical protein ILUMI_25057 [Ignelater luminosus]|uniref:Reverse transcriptase/retrotransposon-derived protein RNase H-like domain-containing protein n=1 Tax=Ignelater luminosus TaxID=2038154 RepID=A0A8K0C632_IGNLU|nr:hypothetical protein ILUMI_25057 [Ignelater luminosus]
MEPNIRERKLILLAMKKQIENAEEWRTVNTSTPSEDKENTPLTSVEQPSSECDNDDLLYDTTYVPDKVNSDSDSARVDDLNRDDSGTNGVSNVKTNLRSNTSALSSRASTPNYSSSSSQATPLSILTSPLKKNSKAHNYSILSSFMYDPNEKSVASLDRHVLRAKWQINGITFIKNAKIVIDVEEKSWLFSNETDNVFELQFEDSLGRKDAKSPQICVEEVLCVDEDHMLSSDEKDALDKLLNNLVKSLSTAKPQKKVLRKEMNEMLSSEVIEPPWASPVVLVPKNDNTWRVAFDQLMDALISPPILQQADKSLPLEIQTDASGYASRAVLLQGEGYEEKPIKNARRLMTPAEKNYDTT